MTQTGYLRVIPITGGSFSGPGIKGTVIPGGADWNTMIGEKTAHVFAKYVIQTDVGVLISVENEGTVDFTQPAMICTTPRFQVQKDSKYAWLQNGVFVGSLVPAPDRSAVLIKIYKLS
jgi:hypothetical protein